MYAVRICFIHYTKAKCGSEIFCAVLCTQLFLAFSQLTQPKKMLPILKFSGHSANLTSVDWSSGRALNTCVTASMDHTLRITNLLTQ